MTIRDVFFSLGLAVMVGWLLVIGKTIILPLVIAVMFTYVLIGAASHLVSLRGMVWCPKWLAYLIVLTLFGLALALIGIIAVSNLRNIAASSPAYEENVQAFASQFGSWFGISNVPNWNTIRGLILDRLDLTDISLGLLTSIASATGYIVLVATYVVFMAAERGPLKLKVELLIHGSQNQERARDMFDRINDQIVTYLSTKTLINVVLGVISFILMWWLGIENAVFWAFLIAIFNYIPYVGSLLGVGIVVFYTAIAEGVDGTLLLTIVLLTGAQVYVGNWLEPRVMSRSFNLSPVVVLTALVVWSSIWGLMGAIIAVPMTSIVMIILAAFNQTRAIPILASRDGEL